MNSLEIYFIYLFNTCTSNTLKPPWSIYLYSIYLYPIYGDFSFYERRVKVM